MQIFKKPINHRDCIIKFLKFLIILTIICVIIFGYTMPSNTTLFKYVEKQNINNGWTQIVGDESFFIDSSKNIIPIAAGEKIILEQTLTTDNTNLDLLLYTKHQEVTILVDDEVIYSLETPEEMSFFASPGKIWINATIPKDSVNKTLRFEFCSQFEKYQNVPNYIYLLDANDIQSVQTNSMWARNTIALVIFAIAIISYINAFIWEDKKLRHYLFALADFYMVVSLWIFSELNILAILFGRTSISSMLAMIFIRIIPVAFYHMGSAANEKNPLWFDILGIVFWCNLILSLILQFIFKISFIAQLEIFTFIIILSLIIFLIFVLLEYIKEPLQRCNRVMFQSSSIIIISGLFEANCYLNHYNYDQYSGIVVSIACIIYSMIIHVCLVSNESITKVKKCELEKHYKILQQKPLSQQINAHFLGNTLNTISAFCKQDPQKADKAVQLLAKYMREYMNIVNHAEYVTFESELYIVELYLSIVSMRFGDTITLKVDNTFESFLLPPLCLQPLVENAIRHGIRQHDRYGVINIKTFKEDNMAKIVISDDGAGFTLDKANSYMGISLTNINSRIVQMGGEMIISSKIAHGTEIVLIVPIAEEND